MMPVLLLQEDVSRFVSDPSFNVCFVIGLSDNCSLPMCNYFLFLFFKEFWHTVSKENSSCSCENVISNNKCHGFYCSDTCCNTGTLQALEYGGICDRKNWRKYGCILVISNCNLVFSKLGNLCPHNKLFPKSVFLNA